jgi:hypothetical protein
VTLRSVSSQCCSAGLRCPRLQGSPPSLGGSPTFMYDVTSMLKPVQCSLFVVDIAVHKGNTIPAMIDHKIGLGLGQTRDAPNTFKSFQNIPKDTMRPSGHPGSEVKPVVTQTFKNGLTCRPAWVQWTTFTCGVVSASRSGNLIHPLYAEDSKCTLNQLFQCGKFGSRTRGAGLLSGA